MTGAGVDVAIVQDQAAVVVLKRVAVEEVDLLGADAVTLGGQPQQRGTGAVAGGGEDEVALDQRRRYVGDVVGDPVVAPQKAAALKRGLARLAGRKPAAPVIATAAEASSGEI